MSASTPLYHRNVAGGPAVKGVECRKCGEYVGLVQSAKTGKWYTCQLVPSMNPDSQARNAYPFLPHYKTCGKARAEFDAKRAARESELRTVIADAEAKLAELDAADTLTERDAIMVETYRDCVATWRKCLEDEGFGA